MSYFGLMIHAGGSRVRRAKAPSEMEIEGDMVPKTTLTVVLGGIVPLDVFAQSMQRFKQLIDALSHEVSGKADIDWTVDELSAGSAVLTIRGETEKIEDVERVVNAYAVVGRALERREVIPYSPRVANAARTLTSVLNGKVTSIRFETDADAATVSVNEPDLSRSHLAALGAVEGRIETLQSRRRMSFTLYDSLNDQAVHCSLRPEQADLVRQAWDRRVIVEGWVKREAFGGRPVEINPVENVTVLPDVAAGSYRQARAIAPARPGDPSPDVVIRRLRDA